MLDYGGSTATCGIGMSMSQSLKLSQRLELRPQLTQKLEQAIKCKLAMKLALRLYLKREDEFKKLYLWAGEHGKLRNYNKHGMNFEYALVPYHKVPAGIVEDYGCAFSHCLYNGFEALFFGRRFALARGQWMMFVVEDAYGGLPYDAIQYAAAHERGEMCTLGDHSLATRLEFGVAAKERKLKWYLGWIEQTCPRKFADVFARQAHLQMPEDEELEASFDEAVQVFLASDEAKHVRQMIEDFEWPLPVLQRLNRYRQTNEKTLQLLTAGLTLTTNRIEDLGAIHPAELRNHILDMVERVLLRLVEADVMSYLSPSWIQEHWSTLTSDIREAHIKQIVHRRELIGQLKALEELKGPSGKEDLSKLPTTGVLATQFTEVLQWLVAKRTQIFGTRS